MTLHENKKESQLTDWFIEISQLRSFLFYLRSAAETASVPALSVLHRSADKS